MFACKCQMSHFLLLMSLRVGQSTQQISVSCSLLPASNTFVLRVNLHIEEQQSYEPYSLMRFFFFFFNIAEERLLSGLSPLISFGPHSHPFLCPSLSGEHTHHRNSRSRGPRGREEQKDGAGGQRSVRSVSQIKPA